MKYDVVIIGAGVTGCAIARELSAQDRLKSICAMSTVRDKKRIALMFILFTTPFELFM